MEKVYSTPKLGYAPSTAEAMMGIALRMGYQGFKLTVNAVCGASLAAWAART